MHNVHEKVNPVKCLVYCTEPKNNETELTIKIITAGSLAPSGLVQVVVVFDCGVRGPRFKSHHGQA